MTSAVSPISSDFCKRHLAAGDVCPVGSPGCASANPRNTRTMSTSGQHRLTLAEAISIAKRGRRLLRTGRITAKTYVVLDCLLWSCRNPATGLISASYRGLMRLCHCARETVAGALAVLERLGVVGRIKRRIKVAWHNGGSASRQLSNAYTLHPGGPDTESSSRPVI